MNKKEIFLWLLIALIIAGFLSSFASSFPDGLERVAEDRAFLEKAEGKAVVNSPISDYTWPGVDSEPIATGLAGISGSLVVFIVSYGIGVILRNR